MEYIIDNSEYYQRPQLWINRTDLLAEWDNLDDLFRLHREKLFKHTELIDHWVTTFLRKAWKQYPSFAHGVSQKL